MAQNIQELKDAVASLTTQLNDKAEALTAAYEQSENREQQRAIAVEALTREQKAHATTKDVLAETTAQRDQLVEEVAAGDTIIGQLNDHITELEDRLGKPAAARTVSHEGREYQVTPGRFHFQGKEYTGADLTSNSELLAELVALKAGVLVAVEDEDEK